MDKHYCVFTFKTDLGYIGMWHFVVGSGGPETNEFYDTLLSEAFQGRARRLGTCSEGQLERVVEELKQIHGFGHYGECAWLSKEAELKSDPVLEPV